MKKFLKPLVIILLSLPCTAQIGITNNNPDKNAVLDLNAGGLTTSTKGLKLPVVQLTATDLPDPLTAHVSGMMVYNKAPAGTAPKQVDAGVYCNDGSQWRRVDPGIPALWGLSGNYDTASTSDFIGTRDAVDFAVRTNNTERMRVTTAGKALIGTTTIPTGGTNAKMIVNSSTAGALQIKDGTQSLNKVLTSDANGVGTWQKQVVVSNIIVKRLANTYGISIPYNTTNYLYTGNSITLNPGRWLVTANILLQTQVATEPNESWWIRSSFSNSSTTIAITTDIQGSALISGCIPPGNFYGLLAGSVVINNASSSPKTYYYIGGSVNTVNHGTTPVLNFAAGVFPENYFMMQKLD